ncbi:hypothetical protein [Escherichia coli]|uniref:Uncharacterized protein n=1 Tax=Escherichia coli TaxID=562 RepID=A0ACD5GC74_ECOLX|nr:hypothetical protein [Escherichia coli]EFN4421506.1 hypothetical protein [Escherichia coli]EFN5073141.1 hypothetical protein [Escherichia coli]EHS1279507.1 hypothetical protein [Escherichia coli]EIT7659774.1 hypothetical protein [Escherichia coli]EIY9332340.1 hypothetical protein [Escherichia coli]
MGSVSQNLKATVSFGGKLDSSWRRSASDLRRDLLDVERQSSRLRKEQARLSAEIKRAKLAGQSVAGLKKEYAKLGVEIAKAGTAQDRLNRQLSQKALAGRFLSGGKSILSGGMRAGLALGGGVVTAGLGALIAPAAANAETARRANVAKSYGVDIATWNAWDSLAQQYDLNAENIGDLFEEYLHKAGEFKQTGKQGALEDAFKTLGFKDGSLSGLSDIEQFNKIVERALSLDDESRASFALDDLFGGEASKLLMLIKRSGKSFSDLLEEQKRYNLVTREGADGAVVGHRALSNLRTVFTSALAEISGQLGNELAPDIEKVSAELAEWFRGGGVKQVAGFIREDLYPGIRKFGEGVVFVGKVMLAVAKKLSWLLPDARSDQQDILAYLAKFGNVDVARRMAEKNGQGEWLEKNLKDNPRFVEDIRQAWNSSKGRFFHDNDAFNRATEKYLSPQDTFDFSLPDATSSAAGDSNAAYWDSVRHGLSRSGNSDGAYQLTDNRKFTYQFTVQTQPGQDPASFADGIADMTRTNPAFKGNNALWDEPWR